MKSAASIKDRLKNRSKETGKTLQELLTEYGLERTIYRISISKYADHFVLKGGIFLYAMFDGKYVRATTDIDFLAQSISNEIKSLREIFENIFSIDADDPLRYDLTALELTSITEFKEYHGVNVSIPAYLDRTRIPISIDIGFGDVIFPDRVQIDFPVLLSEERPHVFAYSLFSVVAEKFEAIVSLAYDNSRFKDYYDIYVLAQKYDFEGGELSEAIKETFEHRNTSLREIVAFENDFSDDPLRLSRWNAFVKKKKAMLPLTLNETIETIKTFLLPVVAAITSESRFDAKWDCMKQTWVEAGNKENKDYTQKSTAY